MPLFAAEQRNFRSLASGFSRPPIAHVKVVEARRRGGRARRQCQPRHDRGAALLRHRARSGRRRLHWPADRSSQPGDPSAACADCRPLRLRHRRRRQRAGHRLPGRPVARRGDDVQLARRSSHERREMRARAIAGRPRAQSRLPRASADADAFAGALANLPPAFRIAVSQLLARLA